MLRLELEWDLLSWQAAFLCLLMSDGEGPWVSGTLSAQGERQGQNPILGGHPPCQTLGWPPRLPLLLATIGCAVFSKFVPRWYLANLSPGRLGEVPRVDREGTGGWVTAKSLSSHLKMATRARLGVSKLCSDKLCDSSKMFQRLQGKWIWVCACGRE